MARRILQFPVRNAFAPAPTQDALARDSQDHAHRIAEQVEREIIRKADRLTASRGAEFEAARNRSVTMMPRPSRLSRFSRMFAAILRSLTPAPVTRR